MFRYHDSAFSLWRGTAWFLLPPGAPPVAISCFANGTTIFLALAVVYALALVGTFLYVKHAFAVNKRVRDTRGALCPRCGDALVGLDDPGRCPECGRAINVGEVVAYWKSTVPKKTWRKWADEASEHQPTPHQVGGPTSGTQHPPDPRSPHIGP